MANLAVSVRESLDLLETMGWRPRDVVWRKDVVISRDALIPPCPRPSEHAQHLTDVRPRRDSTRTEHGQGPARVPILNYYY
eukprot:3116657-Prymnesium_polylepis.1